MPAWPKQSGARTNSNATLQKSIRVQLLRRMQQHTWGWTESRPQRGDGDAMSDSLRSQRCDWLEPERLRRTHDPLARTIAFRTSGTSNHRLSQCVRCSLHFYSRLFLVFRFYSELRFFRSLTSLDLLPPDRLRIIKKRTASAMVLKRHWARIHPPRVSRLKDEQWHLSRLPAGVKRPALLFQISMSVPSCLFTSCSRFRFQRQETRKTCAVN